MLPPTAPASAEPLAKPATPAGDSLCRRAQFRVVLDVGHTAESPGAISARGVPEYEFNLSLANRIEHALIAAGFERTVLAVTAGSARASLAQRVAHANSLPADLFLSIHHDSVPEKFLQIWDYVGAERRFSDQFRGHSIFVSYDNRDRAGSLLFGRLLGLQLKARDLHYTPHYTRADMGRRRRMLVDAKAGVYRYDKLIVLRTTTMPAVLLEAGSIINRDEEMLVVSPERQALVSAAVTSAVEQFCAARAAPGSAGRKRPRVLHAAQPRVRNAMPTPAMNDSGQADRAE
jgi:N-acetylmuramoyl-L-alanine amidase